MAADQDQVSRKLTRSECLALLDSTRVGRLAMPASGGDIDVFPVTFVLDGDVVVFRTAPGAKLDGLHAARRVTFEADSVTGDDDPQDAWSVVVKGSANISRVRPENIGRFDVDVRPWHPTEKRYLVRVIPNQITGRRFIVDRSPGPRGEGVR